MPVAVNGPSNDAGTRRRWPASLSALALATGLAACSSLGPATVRNQQADYASALAEAGKRQTLLNILKLRYGDVPAFVSVSQILTG